MGELKPCPFCGGKALLYKNYSAVECNNCSAKVPNIPQYPEDGYTKAEAIKAWNARAYIEDYVAEAEIRVMNGLAEQLEKARAKLGSGE